MIAACDTLLTAKIVPATLAIATLVDFRTRPNFFGHSTEACRSLTIGGLTQGWETPADPGHLMLLFGGYKVLSIFAVTRGWVAVLPFLSFA